MALVVSVKIFSVWCRFKISEILKPRPGWFRVPVVPKLALIGPPGMLGSAYPAFLKLQGLPKLWFQKTRISTPKG